MRLILLLRFEVTQQDIGSILHLTMRQVEKTEKKKKQNKGKTSSKAFKVKATGFGFAQ